MGDRGPKLPPIDLTEQERAELERWVRRRKTAQDLALRAYRAGLRRGRLQREGQPRPGGIGAPGDQVAPALPRAPAGEAFRILCLWRVVKEGESGAYLSAEEFIRTEGWGGEDGKWTPEMVSGIMVNPFNAIEIDPSLAVPHDPMISEDTWVEVAKRTIDEMGVDFFLRALLRSLKGDYVGAAEGSPYGYQDPQHEVQEAPEIMNYCNSQILRRLRSEPNLLARSFHAFHSDDMTDPEEKAEVLRAESDQSLLREALSVTPETWHEVSEEAHFLVFHYLVKEGKTVGRPSFPPEQRFQITWRVP